MYKTGDINWLLSHYISFTYSCSKVQNCEGKVYTSMSFGRVSFPVEEVKVSKRFK